MLLVAIIVWAVLVGACFAWALICALRTFRRARAAQATLQSRIAVLEAEGLATLETRSAELNAKVAQMQRALEGLERSLAGPRGADDAGRRRRGRAAGGAPDRASMSRRVGAVDIGTNSTRLLVADVSAGGGIAEVERLLEITRLGDRVDAERRLTDEGIARVRAALARYAARAATLEAEPVLAVATSAVRDAENGREFLAEAAAAHGFVPRLLTGEEEAEMTYRGVCSRQAVGAGTLICDIGGGSTELILGGTGRRPRPRQPRHRLCAPVRAPSAHRSAHRGRARRAAGRGGRALPARLTGEARELVGVAGTVTTLATIDMGLEFEIPEAIDGHRLPAEAVDRLLGELAALPLAQRRLVRGLMPERAPTIVAGSVILSAVVAATGAGAVVVSERDILHGAVLAAADILDAGNPKERESS